MSEQQRNSLVRACGQTHVAQRGHNEDTFLIEESLGLMVVADGVGGHLAGEVASKLTCEILSREIAAGSTLLPAIRNANAEVFSAVERGHGKAGMASTVVALHFDGPLYELAWVGDSRAYLWDGSLGLLSLDHSYVESLVRSGQISIEEARVHPRKNVIEQAIGLQGYDNLKIGNNGGQLLSGQVLLLCSDGLNDALSSAQIADVLAGEVPLPARCQHLVSAALEAGGRDNVTVVLLEAGPDLVAVEGAPEPEFVWRYDPVSAVYEGLPELASRLRNTALRC